MSSCPQCGGAVSEGGSFCQYCGTPLKTSLRATICPECSTSNPPSTNFCVGCGGRLDGGDDEDTDLTPGLASRGRYGESSPSLTGETRLVAVRRDGSDGDSFPIVGEQMDIGRSEGDLRFEDPHLAPRHARLARRGPGQYAVIPLEARNGVYIRISQPFELGDGDQFLVGKQVLRFELLSEGEKSLRPAIEHGIVLFGTPVKAPWGRLRQLTAAGTSRDLYHLTRAEVTLGREQGDIVFSDDEFLSRRHAQVAFQGGRVTLHDLNSSNGTYVRLRGEHPLAHGEMIRMGDELLRFEIG
jgi:pSer/pThr/pTyr-binding forkhead associated (FHA) protein